MVGIASLGIPRVYHGGYSLPGCLRVYHGGYSFPGCIKVCTMVGIASLGGYRRVYNGGYSLPGCVKEGQRGAFYAHSLMRRTITRRVLCPFSHNEDHNEARSMPVLP